MTTLIFDTLQYAKGAREAGFTEQQAEFQAEALAQILEDKIATKNDIEDLRKDLRGEIQSVKKDIIIQLGAMIASALVLLPIIIKVI